MIISVFIPNMGCPGNSCVYCNQVATTSSDKVISKEEIELRITNSIAEHILNAKEIVYPVEVAFYAGNFTALDFSLQKDLIRYLQREFERITGKNHNENLKIRISTRPDAIRKEQLLDLKIRFNLDTVEIGAQSMNDYVLYLSKRRHTKDHVSSGAKIIKDMGLNLSIHQMIGLPGATLASEISSAREITRLRPDFVRIHPTLVLRNSELEEMYYKGEYQPLSLEEAVYMTEKVVEVYRESNVKIIRIGLQPSEFLVDSIVAGPWHPSFRELVETNYMLNKATKQLSTKKASKIQSKHSPKDETYVRGTNNSNIKHLENEFGLSSVELIKEPQLVRGSIQIVSEE